MYDLEVGVQPGVFRQSYMDSLSKANDVRLEFVRIEYDLALTFAWIAGDAERDSDRQRRNEGLARLAYRSAIHFSRGLLLSVRDAEQLANKRQEVEKALALM